MKKQTILQTKEKNQIWQYSKNALSEGSVTFINPLPTNWQRPGEVPNIFLVRNKGKGPPGQVRSCRAAPLLHPDHPPDKINNNKP